MSPGAQITNIARFHASMIMSPDSGPPRGPHVTNHALRKSPGIAALFDSVRPRGPGRHRAISLAPNHRLRQGARRVCRAAYGSDLRRITSLRGFEYQPEWSPDGQMLPAWSPDGRKIAFSRPVGGEDFDLGVMTLGARTPRTLTGGPESDNWPEWSPDGRLIAFSRDDELWLMRA